MAKQRFVVYKAVDKHGKFLRQLQVAGGRFMPFGGALDLSRGLRVTTEQLMPYAAFPSVEYWKGFAKERGACRFQKVIYFN